MKILKLTIIAALLAFALAVPATAQKPTLQPTDPPMLSAVELESLAEVATVSAAVAQEVQMARLYLEAAERKAESAQYFGQARRLRILAKRSLDPDLWDVALVNVGTKDQPRQEWRIVPIEPTKSAAKAESGGGEKGGTP